MLTACFSGHRPQRLPWAFDEYDPRHGELLSRLRDAIALSYDEGYRTFLSGGAVGVDIWAAEQTLALKAQLPAIRLHVAIPCAGQEHTWPHKLKARYYGVLSRADDVYVLQPHYTQGCMSARNRFMVKRAARLIVAYDGMEGGGTRQTIDMAEKRGLDIMTVHIPQ